MPLCINVARTGSKKKVRLDVKVSNQHFTDKDITKIVYNSLTSSEEFAFKSAFTDVFAFIPERSPNSQNLHSVALRCSGSEHLPNGVNVNITSTEFCLLVYPGVATFVLK